MEYQEELNITILDLRLDRVNRVFSRLIDEFNKIKFK